MQVILRSDLDGLGKRGDIVEVADGHARNFLLPKGMAFEGQRRCRRPGRPRCAVPATCATPATARRQTVATTLVPKIITITAKAGAEGKLFGSVTVGRHRRGRRASRPASSSTASSCTCEPIKTARQHTVTAKLHSRRVEFPITVEVVRPADVPDSSRPVSSRRPRTTVRGRVAPGMPHAPFALVHMRPPPVHRVVPGRSPQAQLYLCVHTAIVRQGGYPMAGDEHGRSNPARRGRDATIAAAPVVEPRPVPPHNLHAEEILLGALLLSRDVVGVVGELGLHRRPLLQARPTSTSSTRSGPVLDAASRSTPSPSPTSCAAPACSTRSAGPRRCSSCRTPRRRSPTPGTTPRSSRTRRCCAG